MNFSSGTFCRTIRPLSFTSACIAACLALFSSCQPEGPPPEYVPPAAAPVTPEIPYTVVRTLPHDENAFTEGFFFSEGHLFESTGAPDHLPDTRSTFGIVDTVSGKLLVKAELDKKTYFGEGLAPYAGKLYWLTYTNQVCFVYDARTFKRVGQFGYANPQGWGLTTVGDQLVMSDGSYNLTFIEPGTFTPVKTLAVTKDGYALDHINELEYINGHIYANVWMTNQIMKIDPATGQVKGVLDLTQLYNDARQKNPQLSEMNGIAFDSVNNRVLVTGKMWPTMYEIRFNW